MDTYFKIKIFTDFLLPITIIAALLTIAVIWVTVSAVIERRKEKFFLSRGYKRELFGVPSFGNGAFYGWVRESDNMRVDDRDIKGWSLKQIKEKYK